MTNLQKILVEGNPIRSIRRTLLSTPIAEELKAYLRTRGSPPPTTINSSTLLDIKQHQRQQQTFSNENENNENKGDDNQYFLSQSQNKLENNSILFGINNIQNEKDNSLLSNIDWKIRDCVGNCLDLTDLKLRNER